MKLVILDRDGVINRDSDQFVKSADEWQPIKGSIEAIARLSQAGFTVCVATNQSGLGRGLFSLQDLEAMHQKMQQLVEDAGGTIEGIFYCPHHPDDNCDCRKPKAGLITAIEAQFHCSAAGAYTIGDSLRDLQAGLKKQCLPILVKTGKGEKTLRSIREKKIIALQTLPVYVHLAEAADAIIRQHVTGILLFNE